jgi:two-component system, OmpR family, KDP operon response regulator KdpE
MLKARGPAVFVIDDDPAIRLLLRNTLTAAGYRVEEAPLSQAVLQHIIDRQFDLVILDIDESSGMEPDPIGVLHSLSPAAILALSTQDNESAAASALEKGADDYVRKPFGLNELLARAKNALRRRTEERGEPALFSTGDLEIDLLYRHVRLRGQEIRLPVKPYQVLHVLAEGTGRVLTHKEILQSVWGPQRVNRFDYLRIAIRELRRKLEPDPAHPRYILTEPRVGYRLAQDPHRNITRRPAKTGRVKHSTSR